MKGNFVEAIIGAVVLITAAWFLTFTYQRAEMGDIEGYTLIAKFDNVAGISVGGDVRVSGIKVGTVVDNVLDTETFQAVVTMDVRSDVKIPIDSAAAVNSEGILGGNYLALKPGGFDEYLEDGDEIEFTQGSVDLIELVGKAIFSQSEQDKKE